MQPAIDGIHPLKHRDTFGPCLFAELTSNNWPTWLDIAKACGFKWVMTDLFWGDWHTPRLFEDYDNAKLMCREFRRAGIRIATHCYLNTIDANAKLIDFTNPDWDWGDVLEGDDVATVLGIGDRGVRLQSGASGLLHASSNNHLAYSVVAIGKQILGRIRDEGEDFISAVSAEGTTRHEISAGMRVYRLRNRSGFFAKYGSELQAMLVQRFAQTVTDCGIDWVYADGYSSSVQGTDVAETARLHWEHGIAPYAANVPAVFSLGGTVPECAFDRVLSVMRGDAVTLFDRYEGDFAPYFRDQLRWNHHNLPLHQASGWWPLWNGMPPGDIERYYAVRGQVVLQDMPGDRSFLNHPQRAAILRRLRELNARAS